MKKYEKFSKEDYKKWYQKNAAYRTKVSMDPNRLHYHLMPETGWLNDPNGLCQFHGTYHIYYQYTPFEPTGELKSWGHYTTKDFIHYRNETPVLYPDSDIDAHGVYSGSAFIEQGNLHFFYTGNIKYFDRDDYDYITSGRGSNTIHISSKDGFSFGEKELLMTTDDYPRDISCHVRDPKIYKNGDDYFMILGARDRKDQGLILIYHSTDLKSWNYHDRLSTKELFGYMWECPDLFCIDQQILLICCPQGVKQQGIDYENVHQCTWMKLNFDSSTKKFTIAEESFIPLVDRGFDFYAPQSFEDEKGRRILIGWLGIPDATYTNPTVEQGWQHALTLPRQLQFKDGRLLQTPIEELKALRTNKQCYSFSHEKPLNPPIESSIVYETVIQMEDCTNTLLTLRKGVTLSYEDGILTLNLGTYGCGRTTRSVAISHLQALRIYSDTSSLEIFVNNGEEVFSTRVYGFQPSFAIHGMCSGTATIYQLQSFIIENHSCE